MLLTMTQRLLPAGCAVLVLASSLAGQTNVSITSTSATLTLGADTIQATGIASPLTATLQPNGSTPIPTQPAIVFTASTATPDGTYNGILNQTFTVNGVSATRQIIFTLRVQQAVLGHTIFGTVNPATFNLPQGSLYVTPSAVSLATGAQIKPAPGVATIPADQEDWQLRPLPAPPGVFNISTDFPTSVLGGLTGNLVGGIFPQQVSLIPNVPQTIAASSFSPDISVLPFSGGGASTTVTQTLTVNGVSRSFARTLTLTLGGGGCPMNTLLTRSGFQTTLDFGAAGKVDVSEPAYTQTGERAGGPDILGNPLPCTVAGAIIVIPGILDVTVLLHDVPVQPPATPAPPSVLLTLTGLAGAGLYQARRIFARRG